MYVYKALHHLNDNLKVRGLRVRVGLRLDLNLSLSPLGLISVGMHNDRCSPKPVSPHISWYIKPSLPLFI